MNPALRIGDHDVDVAFIVSGGYERIVSGNDDGRCATVKAGFRCEPRLTIYRRRTTGVVLDVLLGGATSSIRGASFLIS